MTVTEINSVEQKLLVDTTAIYGGTFDPFHEGHLTIVTRALKIFRHLIIAPALLNPYKTAKPTPINKRIKMIELILAAEKINFSHDLTSSNCSIYTQGYTFSVELIEIIRSHKIENLCWVIAEDIKDSVSTWKNWQTKGIPCYSFPIINPIHSTNLRSTNSKFHPAIAQFIKENKLYGS